MKLYHGTNIDLLKIKGKAYYDFMLFPNKIFSINSNLPFNLFAKYFAIGSIVGCKCVATILYAKH